MNNASPVAAPSVAVAQPAWLRGSAFDLVFVLGTALLAIGAGIAAQTWPGGFEWILVPYLWLIGYPHLFASYSQTSFDATSFRRHRRLNVELPLVVLAAVTAIVYGIGTWAIVTIYLYWQWFHFARQSYGVSRFYARQAGAHKVGAPLDDDTLTTWIIYAWPVVGILHRSWQQPAAYLDSPVWTLPVPTIVLAGALGLTLVVTLAWLLGRYRLCRRGALPLGHTLYMISHIAMFAVGYLLIADINIGWLVLSIWHSAQYLLFVWHINRSRHGGAPNAQHRLLGAISRPRRALLYALFFLGLSTVIFTALRYGLEAVNSAALPLVLIVFMSINFHHYTVDALIWSRRRHKLAASKPAG